MTNTKRNYIFLGGLAIVIGLLGDVVWGSFYPDPCPARASVDATDFPEQALGSQVGRADALPIFARKHDMTCSTCHSAFPYLNSMGRIYKEGGYRLPGSSNLQYQRQVEVSDNLIVDQQFPIAVSGSSILATKSRDNPVTTSPLDAANLHLAGSIFKLGTAYTKLTAEAGHGLSVTASGRAGANLSPYLNIYGGLGGPFDVDPYNTLSGHQLTATHDHGGQKFLAINGRASKLYYMLGGTAGESGNLATDRFGTARLAFDITPAIELGTFGLFGQEEIAPTATTQQHLMRTIRQFAPGHGDDGTAGLDPAESGEVLGETAEQELALVDVVRAGGDVNLAIGDFHTLGLMEVRRVAHGDVEETNLSGFGEVFYVLTAADRPIFVPLGRVNYQQLNNGQNYNISVLGNVSSYVVANARVGVEYEQEVAVPEGQDLGYRVTGFATWAW